MFPAKDADKEEDRRDEPGQDDHHDHLIMMARLEMNMNINMNEHDDDLVSCAPRSVPGSKLDRTEPAKK